MKPLNQRTLVLSDDSCHPFEKLMSDGDPFYRRLAETWEDGRPFFLKAHPDISQVGVIMDVVANFVSGEQDENGIIKFGTAKKKWFFRTIGDYTVYLLGVDEFIIVQATGDYENVVEGGYTAEYRVLVCQVPEEKGVLEYETRNFPAVPNFAGVQRKTEPFRPSGVRVLNIKDMDTIHDEEVGELQERGIMVVCLPRD